VLYTIAVVLLILWLLGLVSGYTIGAFIHEGKEFAFRLVPPANVLDDDRVARGRRPDDPG